MYGAAAARLRDPADAAARNPPRAAGNPGRRVERLLPPGALDGSRPAIYFINLKSTGDWPKYSLPSLTYHEGVPGHHLQISLAQESKDIPMLRKISFLLGLWRRLGALCRAARRRAWRLQRHRARRLSPVLPVPRRAAGRRHRPQLTSAGAASRRSIIWSRPPASPAPRVQREVERYCASLGQACSYKIGHIAWIRAREKAQEALGAEFDLSEFHEILKEGAMPLTILERRIDERVQAQAGSDGEAQANGGAGGGSG